MPPVYIKGYQTVQVATIEYHSLGRLNNRNLFLAVLEAGKSKIEVLAYSVSGESTLFLIGIWPSSCCTITWQKERERGRERKGEKANALRSLPMRTQNSHGEDPAPHDLMTSSKFNYLPKASLPNII